MMYEYVPCKGVELCLWGHIRLKSWEGTSWKCMAQVYLNRDLSINRDFQATEWTEKRGDSIVGILIIPAKTLRKENTWFAQGLK